MRRRIVARSSTDSTPIRLEHCIDLLALHALAPDRYPFLLQSTAVNAMLGRYDILFAAPAATVSLDRIGGLDAQGGFLKILDGWWQRERIAAPPTTLPFSGGWFLYLGYELAAEIEPGLGLVDDTSMPVAFAARCEAAIVRDNVDRACYVVIEEGADVDVDRLLLDVARTRAAAPVRPPTGAVPLVVEEEPPQRFTRAVAFAKRHIAAGDIYQANLSRGWRARTETALQPGEVYAALRRSNPGPFAGLVRWHDTSIISSSPERLLRLGDGMAATRPIAGTRPRSANRTIDDRLSAELFNNEKERAEHVMLIDLERNDVGRISIPGTVEVNEMMVLESYAHVHHIVSNVRGRLREDVTPGDAIAALFPGGTITGCPKVRCMQIIRELEDVARGAYTGAFGYLNRDGSADLNILIRTMVQRGNELSFRAGSGIVADSEPLAELAETRAKAKGLLRALSP